MLLAAGPLASWRAWALWVSVPHGQWITGVLGGVADSGDTILNS